MLQEKKVNQPGISEEEKRFIGYISSMLHYNSIHFDKKIRKLSERYALVLDDIDVKDEAMEESNTESISEPLEEQISDPSLYAAFLRLTTREREVVNLSICKLLRDREIAQVLGVSQQSVSKTRKKALEKLRKAIIENGGIGYG
ncbi:sigma-70 family RNA polymerase sigma factor [Paenibacillus illinoisensis]|uniref:sigma-70 family RNA polymerase sigma factor n=1 Tax=Paenibacillus illinoisensis TaxID=59845 RepID=UPI003015D86E